METFIQRHTAAFIIGVLSVIVLGVVFLVAVFTDPASAVLGTPLLAVGIAAYFLPGIVSTGRGGSQETAIWILTLLAGWSGIGWLVALIWAIADSKRDRSVSGPEAA